MSTAIHLVLVPGILCDETVWQPQIARLSGLCRIQVASHGLSNSLGEMADRILAAAPQRFALAGHSMGGRVALEVFARAPQRVERLALMDTGFEGLPEGELGEAEKRGRYRLLDLARREGMLAMAKEWAKGMVHPARRDEGDFMDAIHQMIARAPVAMYEAQIAALLSRPSRSPLLTTIAVPTMVLCGHEDAWSPVARHREMADKIPGSVFVDVADCGHMSTLEKPEAINAAMLNWLKTPHT